MSNDGIDFHALVGKDPKSSTLGYIKEMLDHYFNTVDDVELPLIRDAIDVDVAVGSDIDNIGAWFGINRLTNEKDTVYRGKVKGVISARLYPTVDGIQDLFESIIGLRPHIIEDFETLVLLPGQSRDPNELTGQLTMEISIDVTEVFETQKILNDGKTLQLSHTINIDQAGSYAAYHRESDPTHQTDIADVLDAENSTMTVVNIYSPGEKIDVTYQIIPYGDYDTIQELYDNKGFFDLLLNSIVAAGIKTGEITLVKYLRSWFQDAGTEVLTVEDNLNLIEVFFTTPEEPSLTTDYTGFGNDKFDWSTFNRVEQVAQDKLSQLILF
jgi:hypothetical protein